MVYCKKCGTELPDGANFCSKCAAPVNGEDTLDRELKEKQLENEKTKSGCLLMLTGVGTSFLMLLTAGPIVAGINLLVVMVAWIIVTLRGSKK